jgi:hypothetical protein
MPGINNWDLSVFKAVRIPLPKLEESRLQFRADFFNAFNHTQWGYVYNHRKSSLYGQVAAMHPPAANPSLIKVRLLVPSAVQLGIPRTPSRSAGSRENRLCAEFSDSKGRRESRGDAQG